MPLPSRLPLVAAAAVAALAFACSGDASPSPSATGTASATTTAPAGTATSTPTATPTSTRPGVPAGVDAVVNATIEHDWPRLEGMVRLTSLPCGPQQGPGSPPACPTGAATGTNVEVLPVTSCEGELRTKSAVRGTLQQITAVAPTLYGIYRAPAGFMPQSPGDYITVFSRHQTPGTSQGAGFLVKDDRIVAVIFGCQATPAQIVPAGSQAVLVPAG